MSDHNQRLDRVAKVNTLLAEIAGTGRRFFSHDGRVAKMELAKWGKVYFVDARTNRRIYTNSTRHDWRGFTEGGTLRNLVIALRDYIRFGDKLTHQLGPWPKWYGDGDLWDYGDAMKAVREAALGLGILATGGDEAVVVSGNSN